MTLGASALTSLATVKTELSITDVTLDPYLERLINVCSEYAAKYCNRTFEYSASVSEAVAGKGGPFLTVNRLPLGTINSITYDSSAVSASDYSIHDAESGIIFNENGWTWTSVLSTTMTNDPVAGAEQRLYLVNYEGGYVTPAQVSATLTRTLPYALEDAVIMMVSWRYSRRGSGSIIKKEKLMSHAVEYFDHDPVTVLPGVQQILDKYRIEPRF